MAAVDPAQHAVLRRHSKFLPKEGSYQKVPRNLGISEDNVVLGMGTATNAAAGTATFKQTVPRGMILRDLTVACGSVRGRLTSFSASGTNLLLGDTAAVETFAALAQNRPSIDFPVYSGTVVVTVALDAAFTADATMAID